MDDDRDSKKSGPTSRRRRFLKLAGMTTSVAGNYARSRVKGMFQDKEARDRTEESNNAQSGARIAKTLGELKGAAMKVGQLASMAKGILPDDVSSALQGLQRDAPPMPFEVIRTQIESEFGSPPERLFDHFDPVPFASASIGQVHRARTDDGREVVCKVQYPGVDKSVDSDIAHLKLALRASGLIRFRKQAVDKLFEELRDRLHEELDYTNEAENVRLFQRLHREDAHIIIPDVVGERSSGRILTLTYEPGDNLMALDEVGYDQATRNLLGERFTHMMYRHIFEWHTVHADPNPGNFACRKNGDIVMYDFGCVKLVDHQVAADYKRLMLALNAEDFDAVDEAMMRLEFRVPGTERPPLAWYQSLRDALAPAWFTPGILDFSVVNATEAFAGVALSSLKHTRQLQPSSLITFTDRVQGGHYQNLIEMRSEFDFHGIYHSYLNLPQLGDPGFEARIRGRTDR